MLRRVVITGIGAVSPNGIGAQRILGRDQSRTERHRKHAPNFDTSELSSKVAGEVKNFREEDYISAKDRQHVSRVAPLAIAAVQEAIEFAGIDPWR